MRAAGAGHEAVVNILISKAVQVDEQDKVRFALSIILLLLFMVQEAFYLCCEQITLKHPYTCVPH